MGWRRHIEQRHPHLVRDLDNLGAHGEEVSARELHLWAHEEYRNNPHEIDHTHDEFGQMYDLFHDRRQ
jgi:hypothetical protein